MQNLTPSLQFKIAQLQDFDRVAVFIAKINSLPSNHCLHCDTEIQQIRNEINDYYQRNEFCLVMALEGEKLMGVFGGEGDVLPAGKRFWLWGPFVSGEVEDWAKVADTMLAFLLEQMPNNEGLWFFLSVKADKLRAYYKAKGFEERKNQSHVYVASKANYVAHQNPQFALLSNFSIVPFEDAFTTALEELHQKAFPDGGYSVEEMKQLQDEKFPLWVAITSEGDFVGYLFAAVQGENEGYVHFLAVKEAYRKQGIGEALMRKALHWTFEMQKLPQAALTVGDKNNARRLYAKVGFELLYSGVGGVKRKSSKTSN